MKFLPESVQAVAPRDSRPSVGTALRAKLKAGLAGALLLGCALASTAASAGCLGSAPLRGVNMAGAEFNETKLPGTVFKDYMFPSATDLSYFSGQGANTIRLPIRWERLQATTGAEFNAAQVKLINGVIDNAKKLDMCVIIDLHNYGSYNSIPLGKTGNSTADFVRFWQKMNTTFPNVDNVAFGLMNEPVFVNLAQWNASAKAALVGLRNNGSKHLILMAGGVYSGGQSWFQTFSNSGTVTNAEIMGRVTDPLNRTLIEVHQYVDSNFSGTKTDCLTPAKITAIMSKLTEWAKTNNQRLFLGEFGVADSAACLPTLQAMVDEMDKSQWAGWAYWSAGAWWGPSYIFNVHPITGTVHGQMAILKSKWKK